MKTFKKLFPLLVLVLMSTLSFAQGTGTSADPLIVNNGSVRKFTAVNHTYTQSLNWTATSTTGTSTFVDGYGSDAFGVFKGTTVYVKFAGIGDYKITLTEITNDGCTRISAEFFVKVVANSFDIVNFTALNSESCAVFNANKLQTFSFELGQENGGFGTEVGVNDEWTLEYEYSIDGGTTWITTAATSPEENPELSSISANKTGKITLTFKRTVDYVGAAAPSDTDYVFKIRLTSITDGYGNKKTLTSTDPKYNKTFTIHKLPETPVITAD